VINARVAIAPDQLQKIVEDELTVACQAIRANYRIDTMQSFRPGRPVPTHRILDAV
jgi:hypothetical protein